MFRQGIRPKTQKGILCLIKSQQGATSLAEYAITVLLVVGALATMTTYVKRAVQARQRDARDYMIRTISNACDQNCMNATNLVGQETIGQQYEPYYTQATANIVSDRLNKKGLIASDVGKSGTFLSHINSQGENFGKMDQLPPKEAANDIVVGSQDNAN